MSKSILLIITIGFMALLLGPFLLPPTAWLPVTAFYWIYELLVTLLVLVTTFLALRKRKYAMEAPTSRKEILPGVSILIAAHNEASCILKTLESITDLEGVECEVIVASDGSTDGMNELLEQRNGITLLKLPKVGKAAALNAALEVARHQIVVTLDADTRLEPPSVARLMEPFRELEVQAVGGWVFVRNHRSSWLTRWQFLEYVRNLLWRNGLAHLGVLLQVSGAFGAFRRETLLRLGGFDLGSLTEDYEIVYRIHHDFRSRGESYRILTISDAIAYTEAPEGFRDFIAQRTRWFAGFLRTLWAYRGMIGNPAFGPLGLLMLPIKTLDAFLPLYAVLTWFALAAAFIHPRWMMFGNRTNLLLIGSAFLLKWAADITVSVLAWNWHQEPTGKRKCSRRSLPWITIVSESWFFAWFRQVAVLGSYGMAFAKSANWKQRRWNANTVAIPMLTVSFVFVLMEGYLQAQTDANRLIYNFCVQHQGQQVGDGICQTLVNEALHSAGLAWDRGLGQEVWRIASTSRGVVISGDYNKVLPGDIVLFHDIFPDRYRYKGSGGGLFTEHPQSNHIGVVDSLTLDGVSYFNQNAGFQKIVKTDYFSFNDNIDIVDYVAVFRP
ncbi:MAG: glycosyltransferase [Verrucomicrobiota bacterium]